MPPVDVGCSTAPTPFRVFCSDPHPEQAPGFVGMPAGRLGLLHQAAITDRARPEASVAERPVALPRMPRGDAASPGLCALNRPARLSPDPRPALRKTSRKWRSRGNFLLAPGLSIERRRQIVKKPTWLPWQAGETRYDHLKKVRRLTDQRMKRQEAQKQRDEAERGKATAANGSAAIAPELVP
jgi:hypothetical protein